MPGMEECVIRTERLMGGRIGVEFEQGEGSTFWFTIPQKPIIHFAERREIVRAMEIISRMNKYYFIYILHS